MPARSDSSFRRRSFGRPDTEAAVYAAMKAYIGAADRGEFVSLMEPLLIGIGSRFRPSLNDLALA